MKKYIVYFSLFGKKMKTEIFASNIDNAKNQIEKKIVFDKIEEIKITNPIEDFFKGFKK